MTDLLTSGQKRRLTVTLSHLEEVIQTTERLLRNPPQNVFAQVNVYLSPGEREEIERRLGDMRALLADASVAFSLPASQVEDWQVIRAPLAQMWAALEDTTSAKLGRYGPIDPALPAELDPTIERLIALLEEILAVLERPA
jgi:hypothetical protein